VSLRGTLALLVALLALGGYVWFFEIRGAERKAEAEAAAKLIFHVDPATVTSLELETSDGSKAQLVRGAADSASPGWRLSAPISYPADADAVERALRALEKLSSTATIDERPADLEPFGLGASRKRVAARAGEAEPRELFLGANTPVGGGRYVELADDGKRLFVVSTGSLGGLTPSLVELRDKRLLRVATSQVQELEVLSGQTRIVRAKRTEAGWELLEPESAPADAEKIERLLDDLALARASGFEDAPRARAEYGLERPEVELVARAGDAEERLRLASRDGGHWLERAGDPVILAVNERVSSAIPRAFFAYRQKRVLTLDVEQVHALEIEFPREAQTKRLVREGEVWRLEPKGPEPKPLEVEDLLYALAALDATALENASAERKAIGLDPALAVIRARDASGGLLGELSLGDPHPELGLSALSSQGPLVWRVSNDLGREVPLSPEAFANLLLQSAPEAAPSQAQPVEPGAPASP